MNMIIKPGVTASGFRTAVRDYTEYTVVEELAANSYDADASTVVVLLDSHRGQILVIDDGKGFTGEAFEKIATLGGGDKADVSYSQGKRHYLGSYGVGLKSTLNIASKLEVHSFSSEGEFKTEIDWSKENVQVVFVWTAGKWRMGAKKKGRGGAFELIDMTPRKRGHLKLLEYASMGSKKPRRDYQVIVVEELLK